MMLPCFLNQVIINLIPVLSNTLSNLTRVHPRHKVLHSHRHQERRVRHHLRSNPHMALLDKRRSIAHRLRHPQLAHHDRQPPPAERSNGHLGLEVANLWLAASSGGGQNAHVLKFGEGKGLVLAADWVCGIELGQAVRKLADRAAELVVLGVVVSVLEVVALDYRGLAVAVVLFPLLLRVSHRLLNNNNNNNNQKAKWQNSFEKKRQK